MSKVLRYKADEVTSCTSPYTDIMTQEVLAQGFCLRVKGRGFSMYPFVRTGDTLLIEPKSPAELDIGDIIFYRRHKGIYVAHRLIKKNGSATLITKGDNLRYYDEPVPVKKVLGRVISIERDGRYLRLDSKLNKFVNRFWASLSPMSWWLRPKFKPWWRLYQRFSPTGLRGQFELCIERIQGKSIYRKVARSLRTGIEIKEADKEDIKQILRWFNMDPVEHTVSENINSTGFVAKKGGRIIGYVDLVRRSEQYYPFDGYWLHSLIVKIPYRRMGIGEELTWIATEKGREEGAKGLSLLVYEDNYRAIKLYRKLGFEIRVIPALEKKLEEEQRATGRRQVFMFADLG